MPIILRVHGASPIEVASSDLTEQLANGCVWIDLQNPTPEEVKAVETVLKLEIPTSEEMKEIESTSRLYCENGVRVMNTPLMINTTSERPELTEVSFIFARQHLLTLRESDPASFRLTAQQISRGGVGAKRDAIFVALLESIVDRQADMMERLSKEVDEVSERIFRHYDRSRDTELNLREAIYSLGRGGDLVARQRDCIVAFSRLVHYAGHEDFDETALVDQPLPIFPRLKPIARDLQSISEFAQFLSNKINFLLDATLGLISIEQNSIVKIFTVAAVIFLPPTLVASLYGMNFKYMPELDKVWGYPFAIGMMALSVTVPIIYCRRKGWL